MRKRLNPDRLLTARLLALALLLKALVPLGWMPALADGEFRIRPCPSWMPSIEAPRHGHHGEPDKDQNHDKPEQPCAFAGLAMASLEGDRANLTDALPPAPIVPQNRPEIAIGRGLAAPPPPQTGPPQLI